MYRFDKIFNQAAKQDEVFQNVARPVVDRYSLSFNTVSE